MCPYLLRNFRWTNVHLTYTTTSLSWNLHQARDNVKFCSKVYFNYPGTCLKREQTFNKSSCKGKKTKIKVKLSIIILILMIKKKAETKRINNFLKTILWERNGPRIQILMCLYLKLMLSTVKYSPFICGFQ